MVAIGSRPALYARTMYGEALKSNANEQMRSRAQGHEVALAKAATATAQANAQAACCQAATARIVVLAGYSRCGTRSCGCHRRVPVYRSYCSIRRAYRYRSYCYRTHAWNYNSYSYPGSMIWDTGFGPR
jgi:hypothetical protein